MKRICSAILSSLIVIFMLSMSVTAEGESNPLAAYQEVLNLFNDQFGMSARFPTESELSKMGLTIQDRNNFITAMTTDEYFNYLVSTCPNIDNNIVYETGNSSSEQDASEPGMTREIQQKYVYDSNDSNKYLYICVTRYYVNGTCYYGSIYNGGCTYGTTYPFYDYNSHNYSFQSNSTKASVTFNCSYCPSPGVTYSGVTVQCKFRASDNTIYDPQLYI